MMLQSHIQICKPVFYRHRYYFLNIFAAILVPGSFRIPSCNLTHCSLPHCALDLDLHTLYALLEGCIFLRVTLLASSLPDIPSKNNYYRYRDSYCPVNPELIRYDGGTRVRGVT